MCDLLTDPYVAQLRAADARLHDALAEAIRVATRTRDALDTALTAIASPAPASVPLPSRSTAAAGAGDLSTQGATA